MRIMQGAQRIAVLAVAALALGCGESGPSTPFDADGTSGDVGVVQGMFATESFASFSAVSGSIDHVVSGAVAGIGGVQAGAVPGGLIGGTERLARQVARILPAERAPGLSASSAVIPPAALGKTYVYDVSAEDYVVSGDAGAPADGVRFILYAVDPLTQRPATPLNPTGHVDVVDRGSGNTVTVEIIAVSGTTTFLDYTVTGTGSQSSASVRVFGFISNLTDRANFDLDTRVQASGGGGTVTIDYSVDVPSRQTSLDFTLGATVGSSGSGQGNLSLKLQGSHGKVEINGDFDETGGTMGLKVNGDAFATVTVDANFNSTVTGKDGQPLTDAERTAFQRVVQVVQDATDVFGALLAPVDSAVSD
jgi:hypothetical protein